jgi:anti-sigma B factor antagonist
MTKLARGDRLTHVPMTPDHGGRTPQLAVAIRHDGDGTTVSVTGEMDLATAPSFQRQALSLFSLPVESVTLDLAGLEFIDSSGLRALIAIRDAAEAHRVHLALRSVPEQARLVLAVTNLTDSFVTEA